MNIKTTLFRFRTRLQPSVSVDRECPEACREKKDKKKLIQGLTFICFLVLFLFNTTRLDAQTTLTTTSTSGGGGSSSGCTGQTFTFKNTNSFDVLVTDVGYAPYGAYTHELYYSLTSLTGTANITSWTLAGTTSSTGASTTINPNFFTGLSVLVPAGATIRFGIAVQGGIIRFASSSGTNPVTAGGGELYTDSYWASCASASITGPSYCFYGSITFKPAAIPCTGAPTNTIVGPSDICPNEPFSLKFQTLYSGVKYEWEKSTNGTTWAKFTGTMDPNNGAITDAISVNSWYRCKITCIASGQVFTTTAKLVKILPFYYCYCKGSKATGTPGGDIGNVKVQSLSNAAVKLDNGTALPVINNTTSKETYNDYRFSVPPVTVYRDSSYVFTVSQINSAAFNPAIAAIFIDYNRNGRFEDTVERVLLEKTANLLPTPGVVRDTFRIPDTAVIGTTGMRVILRTGAANPDTCGLYSDGETEDYLVDIRYEQCTTAVNPGIVTTADTSMCPGYTYGIANATHERKKSDITWWWQYSPDGLVWDNLPNSTNKDTFNNIMFSNTIYYRTKMVCENTRDTTISAARKVEQKAAYKCYCYSLADGNVNNNDIDSSDIGAVGLGSMLLASNGPHIGNNLAIYARKDHTDLAPLELETERRYNLLVYHTMNRYDHADAKVTVFMDFNNNKQYDIPQERVGTWFTSINSHTIIDSIYIPDSAIVNVPTGMRVILNNNVAPNLQSDFACGTFTSGETEDFIVMFKRAIVTGVQTVKSISNLGLYPNPTSGKFRIQFDGAGKNVVVTVSTATGQQVEQRSYNHHGGLFSEEIDMSSHAKGIYFVELQADGEKMTKKLVIQ